MKHELCCRWLGLPSGSWPPDYYSLLGLPPGAGDVERIEHEVHSRLAKVRCYQLSHPELATEAMNLLAHALLCLCDPSAKRDYDQQRGIVNPAIPASNGSRQAAANDTAERIAAATSEQVPTATLDWQQAPPPPVRGAAGPAIPGPAAVAEEQGQGPPAPVNPPAVAPPAPVAKPADTAFDAASPAARRGLGTPAAIFDRIHYTRQLLWAWEQAGKFVNKPARRVAKPAEEKELARRLQAVCELIDELPPLVGHPGQPGYRVVAMGRLELTAPMFKNLDRTQREALAKDWLAANIVLKAHRQFLKKELRSIKHQGWFGRTMRAVRAALNDNPGWVLFAIGVASVLVVLVNVFIYSKL